MALLVDGVTSYTVASDLISGTHWPYSKLAGGVAGTEQPIPGTTANGLLVDVSRIQGTVQVGASTGLPVVGRAAAGTTPVGNPVRVAAVAEGTPPAAQSDGNLVDLWATTRGALVTAGLPMTPTPGAKIAGATGSLDVFDDLDGQTPISIVAETALPDDDNGLTSGVINWLYLHWGSDAATADNWSWRLAPGETLDTLDWHYQPSGDVKAWWADQDGVTAANSIIRRATYPVA
ncbi:MAG: hypothetical protein AB7G37_03480 [Solirubrobacteraceae bacterium]